MYDHPGPAQLRRVIIRCPSLLGYRVELLAGRLATLRGALALTDDELEARLDEAALPELLLRREVIAREEAVAEAPDAGST